MRIARSTSAARSAASPPWLLAIAAALVSCDKKQNAEPASSGAPSAPAPSARPTSAPSASSLAATASASAAAANARYDVLACCRALSAEAKNAGPSQAKYTTAAAVCAGIARQVKKGIADDSAARSLIRAQLQGLPLPGVC